ncbi:MAG: SBBP repeat-containing protein, partial [Syntrophaceae bacterium]|nr:SBBP repeat-containing protein [Syntrophaceae bacterium]
LFTINIGIVVALLANSTSAQDNRNDKTARLSSKPLSLEWTYFIGGSDRDGMGWRNPILQNDSTVYFTGVTKSPDFPVTPDAMDSTYNGGSQQWGKEDIFLMKFNTHQRKITYSTFLGGATGPEHPEDVFVDNAENVYLVGNTGSSDFPVTSDALIPKFQGPDFRHADGFFTILSNDGRKLKYSTFIGGPKNDGVSQIFMEPSGDIVLFGVSDSIDFLSSPKNNSGAYVMKLDAKEQIIRSACTLGDIKEMNVQQLKSGDYLIVGSTANSGITTTKGAFDQSYNGGENSWGGDLYIMQLTKDLKTIKFATLFGGSGDDYIAKILCLPGGDFCVIGWTTSKDLPVSKDALEKNFTSKNASFFARFGEDGKQLKYCTYIGGNGAESGTYAKNLMFDGHSKVYVAGYTSSPDFPVTADAFQTNKSGGDDIFILAFDIIDNSLVNCTYFGGTGNDWEPRLFFDQQGAMYILGTTDSDDFPTDVMHQSIRKERDLFISKFSIKQSH